VKVDTAEISGSAAIAEIVAKTESRMKFFIGTPDI
jgi:hypothetical protein